MSELVRFGVAMDRELLAAFDRAIGERGYENRSEALRDLVRADLTRRAFESGAPVVASLTIVYAHHVRELLQRLVEIDGETASLVVCSTHVRLDAVRSLDVLVLKGRPTELVAIQNRVAGARGVLTAELTPASPRSGPGDR